MNKRKRIIGAITHQETDIIPYAGSFTHQEEEKIIQYTGDTTYSERLGSHIKSVYFDGFLLEEPEHPGYFKDDFGVRWNRNGADKDIGVIDNIVIKEPDITSYHFPKIRHQEIHESFKNLVRQKGNAFFLGNIGFSMFERAWTLRGMENFLTDMLLEPAFAEAFLDAICDFNMEIIDIALEYDIDGFQFGDDWGQQRGLIMGPRLWRKFIKPRMSRMYDKVKSTGKFVFQHSCGDIHEIFPDLIEIGLDVYQTFQPEIYDIGKVKQEFGADLCFWGGISTQRLLPFATPEEVKQETARIMKIMGKNGGYIAGPTHSVPGDVPPENIAAMMEVFENQHLFL